MTRLNLIIPRLPLDQYVLHSCGHDERGRFKSGNTCWKLKKNIQAGVKRATAKLKAREIGEAEGKPAVPSGGDDVRRRRTAGRLRDQRAQILEAKASPVKSIHPESVHFDPERFQYKLGHSATTGSVGSLAGVKTWNPELGGIMQVWKDPSDKKTYVINGHNRLDLAKRTGASSVLTQEIKAPTPEAAKAKGALTNIAEGRGTSIDAANFFRSSGISKEDLEHHGIPMKERVATEGLALARLPEPVFRRVIEGTVNPEKAAMIGGSGLSHAQQTAVVKQMDKASKSSPMTTGHLKELLENAREAGSATTRGFDLFGANEEETSLALHRAKVQSAIRDRLSREKRLFGTVAKSRAAEDLAKAGNVINAGESGRVSQEAGNTLDIFDQLKNRSGTMIPHHLNKAAERIHAGEHPRKVTEEAYGSILEEARNLLGQGQARTA